MIICICGKSGSGKTTFAKKLQERIKNAIYIDIDKIAHDVLDDKNVIEEIRMFLGNDVFDDAVVNRKKLGQRVFHNALEMTYLKKITWPLMEKIIDRIMQKNNDKVIILDYLFLPETKYFDQDSLKIYLDIPLDVRKKRIMSRDLISDKEFLLREKNSPNYPKQLFDLLINDDTLIKIIKGI